MNADESSEYAGSCGKEQSTAGMVTCPNPGMRLNLPALRLASMGGKERNPDLAYPIASCMPVEDGLNSPPNCRAFLSCVLFILYPLARSKQAWKSPVEEEPVGLLCCFPQEQHTVHPVSRLSRRPDMTAFSREAGAFLVGSHPARGSLLGQSAAPGTNTR